MHENGKDSTRSVEDSLQTYRYEGKCGEVLVFLSVKQKPNTHNKAKMEDVQQQIKQSRLIQY